MEKTDEYQVNIDKAIEQYGVMVGRLARLHTTSIQDAEDIYQEVFIKLYRNQEHIESEEHLKAWLIRVTMNECHSQARKAYRHHEVFMEDAAPIEQAVESFEEQFTNDEVYQKVEKLPKKYREVVLLYYYEDLSIKEIADTLGISENTVKTRLVRARTRLLVLLAILILVIAAAIILGRYYWQSLRPVSREEISHVYTPNELEEAIRVLVPVPVGDEVLVGLPEGSDASIEKGKLSVWWLDEEQSGQHVLWLNTSDMEKLIDSKAVDGEETIMRAKIPDCRFIVADSSGNREACTAVELERGEDYAIYEISLVVEEPNSILTPGHFHYLTLEVETDSDYEQVEILRCYEDSEEDIESTQEVYTLTEGVHVRPYAFMRTIGYDEEGRVLPFDEWEGTSGVFEGFDFSGELIVYTEPITLEDDPQYVFTFLDSEGNVYWTDMSTSLRTEE